MQELSARVSFKDVVKRFEKIASTPVHKQKAELVGKFFKSISVLQETFRNEVGPNAVNIILISRFFSSTPFDLAKIIRDIIFIKKIIKPSYWQ